MNIKSKPTTVSAHFLSHSKHISVPRAGLVFSVRLRIAILHAWPAVEGEEVEWPVELFVWRGREEKSTILISVSKSLLAHHKVCLAAVQYSWTRRLSAEPLKSCRQLYTFHRLRGDVTAPLVNYAATQFSPDLGPGLDADFFMSRTHWIKYMKSSASE